MTREETRGAPPKPSRLAVLVGLGLAGAISSCHCPPQDPPPEPDCPDPNVEIDPSIVFHDLALLGPRFPLRKTLQAMVDSSGAAGTPESLLQSMLDSFAASSFTNAAGKQVPVEPRPGEAGLSAGALLDASAPDGMIPTGLFNRFDLAPSGAATCGEYRITYAKKASGTPGRFLLIFEAVVENPTPALGLAGCAPITDFWTDLSSVPDPAERADRLEQFYYQGLGGGAGPVVTYRNYGVSLGQVRSNLFIQFAEWRLREHKADPDISSGPRFVPDTVKENPIAAMFHDPSQLPAGWSAADQQDFRAHFLGLPVCNLVRPDRVDASATEFDVVNGIGAGFDPAANDFESISQGDEDNPAVGTDPALAADIATRLGALSTPGISSEQLLNRAGAMTCGGCHQFSNGTPLGNGHAWPPSAGFVHIQENGSLSPALNDFLLPRRRQVLHDFKCDRTPDPQPVADCLVPGPQGLGEDLTPLLRAVDEADSAYREALRALRPEALREEGGPPTLRALEAAVRRAREVERSLPGAFVPRRRVH